MTNPIMDSRSLMGLSIVDPTSTGSMSVVSTFLLTLLKIENSETTYCCIYPCNANCFRL